MSLLQNFTSQANLPLASRYRYCALIQYSLVCIVLMAVCLSAPVFIQTTSHVIGFILWLCVWLVPGIMFLWLITTVVSSAKARYGYTEKEVYFLYGWLTPSLTTVPIKRIQHVELSQGVISRLFKLYSVTLLTAGHGLSLPGLEKEQAEALRDLVLANIETEDDE